MADEKTRADSLRFYLTGAASDGGTQTDPDASLGNYRSSTLDEYFDQNVTSAISNVTIDFVSGAHAEGNGTLTADSVDTLTWTPPGGSAGAAVTIANGETKVLEGSGAPEQYIRVSRTTADDLTGAATVALTKKYNNAIGFDNVEASEASAGDTEYRAMMVKNESTVSVENVKVYIATLGTQRVSDTTQLGASGAGTVESSTASAFADWPESGFCRIEDSGNTLQEIVYYSSRTDTVLTVPSAGRGLLGTSASAGAATDLIYPVPGIRIAKEAPSSDAIQTIADESTAPTSVTWSTGITSAGGIDIGTLAASALYGLWVERVVVAGATSAASVEQALTWAFDAV